MKYQLFIGNQAYSSWSLRGWLLLRAFGLEFDHRVVRLFHRDFDGFLGDCFPAATVPALRVGDGDSEYILWDSLAIAEYLHEQHPQAGIWPTSAAARASARCLAAEMHSSYLALREKLPMNTRRVYPGFEIDAGARRDIKRIGSLWRWAADRFGGDGPWLFGRDFCAADAFYAPVASRFRTYQVPVDEASARYVDALLEHPAVAEFYAAGAAEPWVIDQSELA